MSLIFQVDDHRFPYDSFRFPGQASDENILYVSREARFMLLVRLLGVWTVSITIGLIGLLVPLFVPGLPQQVVLLSGMGMVLLAFLFLIVGSWWMFRLWKQSLFILTNRRLTKFIYTTPWNRYNLSLGLDKIVDTGAYMRGYLQAFLGIGTFTARSSAGNRQEKYFYVENVHVPEDFANYVNKVLHVFNQDAERLANYRPFIPHLKGERRKKFMERYPQFWS